MCECHESDGLVTEIVVTSRGWPHEITHCAVCGRGLSTAISPHGRPDDFLKHADKEAIAYCQSLGVLPKGN